MRSPRCTSTMTRSIIARACRGISRRKSRSATRYPDDDEAQIAYAITLNVAASPADKTYANQLKGAALLEPIFKRQPDHPGVAHYLIHLYDYPPLAEKGLEAAKRYAKIAPAAPHAQHMPSHIFTRVGYWNNSIASNKESARVAKEGGEQHDQAHAMDYLVYAYLQLAQDKEARGVVDELTKLEFKIERFPVRTRSRQVKPAMRSNAAIGRQPAELQVRPTKYLYVDAITYFARAVGAARSGNPTAATADIAKLVELRDKLKEAKDAYWSNIVDIQQQVASAWVLYAEGKYDEALNAMSAAAEAEDEADKHPRDAGTACAGARALRGNAARPRHGQRGTCGFTKPCSRRSPIGWRLMLARPKAPRPPAIRPRPENMRRRLLGSPRMPM